MLVALLYVALDVRCLPQQGQGHSPRLSRRARRPQHPDPQHLGVHRRGGRLRPGVRHRFFIVWRFRDQRAPTTTRTSPSRCTATPRLEIGWTIAARRDPGRASASSPCITHHRPEQARRPRRMQVKVVRPAVVVGLPLRRRRRRQLRRRRATSPPPPSWSSRSAARSSCTITSNDVIHSFWIPALNGKKDAVPASTTHWKLEADEPGVFRGQCTEFCGLSHANMRMLVRAVPQDDYDALAREPAQAGGPSRPPAREAAAGQGRLQFGQLCSSCHLIHGVNDDKVEKADGRQAASWSSGVAPDLTHFDDPRHLRRVDLQPLRRPDPTTGRSGQPGNADRRRAARQPGRRAATAATATPTTFNRPALEAWLRNPPAVKPHRQRPTRDGSCGACPTWASPRTRSTSSSPTSRR